MEREGGRGGGGASEQSQSVTYHCIATLNVRNVPIIYSQCACLYFIN